MTFFSISQIVARSNTPKKLLPGWLVVVGRGAYKNITGDLERDEWLGARNAKTHSTSSSETHLHLPTHPNDNTISPYLLVTFSISPCFRFVCFSVLLLCDNEQTFFSIFLSISLLHIQLLRGLSVSFCRLIHQFYYLCLFLYPM
jgi:hypothetical protein